MLKHKSLLRDSTFNMFLSVVHWACINEKSPSAFALWGGMSKNCEIFNNSEWYSPFFKFLEYLAHGWFASKPLTSSSIKRLFVIFFKIHKLVKKNTSLISTPLFIKNYDRRFYVVPYRCQITFKIWRSFNKWHIVYIPEIYELSKKPTQTENLGLKKRICQGKTGRR